MLQLNFSAMLIPVSPLIDISDVIHVSFAAHVYTHTNAPEHFGLPVKNTQLKVGDFDIMLATCIPY